MDTLNYSRAFNRSAFSMLKKPVLAIRVVFPFIYCGKTNSQLMD